MLVYFSGKPRRVHACSRSSHNHALVHAKPAASVTSYFCLHLLINNHHHRDGRWGDCDTVGTNKNGRFFEFFKFSSGYFWKMAVFTCFLACYGVLDATRNIFWGPRDHFVWVFGHFRGPRALKKGQIWPKLPKNCNFYWVFLTNCRLIVVSGMLDDVKWQNELFLWRPWTFRVILAILGVRMPRKWEIWPFPKNGQKPSQNGHGGPKNVFVSIWHNVRC